MRTEIAALLLVVVVIAGVPAGVVAYDRMVPASATEITLVGHTPLNGNWSQREIHVRQGERVRIRLTSEDVTHGFYIPDLNVNAGQITPGRVKTVEFTAETKGTFTFYCNNLCSHEHGAMVGKLIVQ